jgi:hypothetical protein
MKRGTSTSPVTTRFLSRRAAGLATEEACFCDIHLAIKYCEPTTYPTTGIQDRRVMRVYRVRSIRFAPNLISRELPNDNRKSGLLDPKLL